MNIDIFKTKQSFDDLEIKTSDGMLYISKTWLCCISHYFSTMFNGNFSESNQNTIELSYESKILILLFKCILFGYNGNEYIENEYLEKLQ